MSSWRGAALRTWQFGLAGIVALALSACGGGGSNGTTSPPPVTPPASVKIVTQPAAQKAELSTRASFTVTADAATGYQWQRDSGSGWQDIARATSASYTTGFLLASDDGSKFRVTVSNAGSSLASDTASLSVAVPALELKLLAGSIAGPGHEDGPLNAAKFMSPMAVTRDAAGNVYVADWYAVRKITPAGIVSTFAGKPGTSGSVNAAGAEARLGWIVSMTVDGQGNLYVGESNAGTGNFIRKITPAGVVSFVAGAPLRNGHGGLWDGVGSGASFNSIWQMAADRSGNLYVTDSGALRKVQPDGTVTSVKTLTCGGCVYGSTDLDSLSGIVIDSADTIWLFDSGLLRKVTPAGVIFDVAGNDDGSPSGPLDGQGFSAKFANSHAALTLDSNGNLLMAERDSSDQKTVIRRITPSGRVTTIAGQGRSPGLQDGPAADATFGGVWGLVADANGGAYIADRRNSAIRYLSSAGVVSTVAGQQETQGQGSVDGQAAAARFKLPGAVAVDAAGHAIVSDCGNATLRKITRDGTVTTVAGAAGQPGQVDGKGTASRIQCPSALAFGNDSTLYFNDVSPGADVSVRRLAPDGLVDTWSVRQSVVTHPVVSGLAVGSGGDLLAAVNQPGMVGSSFILRLAANGTSTEFATYNVPYELKGWGFAGLAANTQGQLFATEYRIPGASDRYLATGRSAISAAGVRTSLATFDSVYGDYKFKDIGAAVLDARGDAYVIDGTELKKVAPDGAITVMMGSPTDFTTHLGAAPSLRNSRGLAIWGPNQLLVTTENAVLILTVPGVACDCKGR
jgi:hypothetical protein